MHSMRFTRVLVAVTVFALFAFSFLYSNFETNADKQSIHHPPTPKLTGEVDHGGSGESSGSSQREGGAALISPVTQAQLNGAGASPARPSPTLANTAKTEISSSPEPAPVLSGSTVKPAIAPSDVVLILKTGSGNVWRRLPLHLLTTFANNRIPNYAIYSDAVERFPGGFSTINIIANISTYLSTHDPAAHSIYADQNSLLRPNVYREQVGLPGDTLPLETSEGKVEGWILDRYKFLPMLAHAYTTWPAAKWYVYIEDDTFLFWHNILHWLARQSHTEVAYHGAISGPSDATFAQGGSGIVFTQALMRHVFAGAQHADLARFGNLTAQGCCGDIILGDIMREYGISVNRGEFGTQSFRPEPPWKTRFDRAVWCEPVMTFHHLHQQDVGLLAELEEEQVRDEGRPKILFRDVYLKLIDPWLREERVGGWDNYADLWRLRVGGEVSAELQGVDVDVRKAVGSSEGCRDACLKVEACFSWRYDGRECALDAGVKFGHATTNYEHGNATVVSGWILPRLNETLLSHECWGFRD